MKSKIQGLWNLSQITKKKLLAASQRPDWPYWCLWERLHCRSASGRSDHLLQPNKRRAGKTCSNINKKPSVRNSNPLWTLGMAGLAGWCRSASSVLAAQPLRTSRLKTIHRIVFFTPLTLSGFESLLPTKAKDTGYLTVICVFWYGWRDSNPRPFGS